MLWSQVDELRSVNLCQGAEMVLYHHDKALKMNLQ